MPAPEPWKVENESTVYRCRLFGIQERNSRSPQTGRTYPFYVLTTHDWVNVVALTAEKQVVLIRQYRHGTGCLTLEIPGGAVDPGEDALSAAQRELREETGYTASTWVRLGAVEPNPAFQTNLCTTFLALDAVWEGQQEPDETEDIEVLCRDHEELPKLIEDGKIQHALVVAAIHYYDMWRHKNQGM